MKIYYETISNLYYRQHTDDVDVSINRNFNKKKLIIFIDKIVKQIEKMFYNNMNIMK